MKGETDIMKADANEYTPVPRKSLADFKRGDERRGEVVATEDGIRIAEIYPQVPYDIEDGRIDTPLKLVKFLRDFCDKKYVTRTMVKGLLSVAFDRFGWEERDFADSKPPAEDWLVTGVIAKGYVGVISGPPFVGKSFFGLHLAYAVATGRDFLGMSVPRARRVAYFNAKLDERGLWERFAAIERATGVKPEAGMLYYFGLHGLHYKRKEKMMANVIAENVERESKSDLVVIDDATHFSGDVFAYLVDRLSKSSAVALMAEREDKRYGDFAFSLQRNKADDDGLMLHVGGRRCVKPTAVELKFRDGALALAKRTDGDERQEEKK